MAFDDNNTTDLPVPAEDYVPQEDVNPSSQPPTVEHSDVAPETTGTLSFHMDDDSPDSATFQIDVNAIETQQLFARLNELLRKIPPPGK